ncbi:hypothetical protein [Pedobacter deserti]|uniref:hypothetical protein n=1 Tax=Pedobacter deserti TaxID=2817382 RepID=UPI002109F2BD|nr:hypothetical protein [Pedobacter sp. SYSU D00382]
MKRFYLITTLVLSILTAYGQANFRAGYRLTNSGDTIKGLVDYRERGINPRKLVFKQSKDDSPELINMNECPAFGIDGLADFERWSVRISLSRESYHQLSTGPDTTSKADTVYLQRLFRGSKFKLFSYRDDRKKRFYYQETAGQPVELIRRFYYDPNQPGKIIKANRYLNQLSLLFKTYSNSAKAEDHLTKVAYREQDLFSTFAMLDPAYEARDKRGLSYRLFAGAGINFSAAEYSGDHILAGPEALKEAQFSPVIQVGVDFLANPEIGQSVFRLEALFSRSGYKVYSTKPDIHGWSGEHVFKMSTLHINPQFIYHFYNTHKIKFFGGLGAGLNFSFYHENVSTNVHRISTAIPDRVYVQENGVELKKFQFMPNGCFGMVVHKRFEISGTYFISTSLTDYRAYGISLSGISVGINYRFSK